MSSAKVAAPAQPTRAPAPARVLQRCGAHPCAPGGCAKAGPVPSHLAHDATKVPTVDVVDDPSAEREAEASAHAAAAGRGVTLRRAARSPVATRSSTAPPSVAATIARTGRPLEPGVRHGFEASFGTDLARVRVHDDGAAAASAADVDALAYTVGPHVVFARGRYAPETAAGRRLLAHELTHVVQQDGGGPALQRTPARQVSCAPGPLNVPGAPPLAIADPVAEITAAENRASAMLDGAIAELDFTRRRIVAGAPAAWPTIGDVLAQALRVAGLDPDDRAAWTGNGPGTIGLFLTRLRLIRRPIGAGSFFFTCIGPDTGDIGSCSGPICRGGNIAASCPGSFRMHFCPPWWRASAEFRARNIIHETAHNFADFMGHTGRQANVECFARFAQIIAEVPEAEQRLDLCPDP